MNHNDSQFENDAKGTLSRRSPFFFVLFIVGLCFLIVAVWFLLFNEKASSADPAVTEHLVEDGKMIWSISEYPALVLQNNTFTVTLFDKHGVPVKGAQMKIRLDMIGMACGHYDFELAETAAGVYVGEGVPLMAGLWKASLNLKNDGREQQIVRTLKAVH
ncbi:hypothetical protein ACFQZE_03880 [Paenibacillus sp. GCM10027627]|uniref:hypothetical protein n=1 Tax=unclassified Paenibacillus TaxID=185978 RepID=UPI0036412C5E